MRVALAFAAVAILCVDAFSPSAPSLRSVPRTSTIRMRGEAGSGFERRDALRVLVGGTAAAVAGSFAGSVVEAPIGDLSAGIPASQWERWSLIPAAQAYTETKEELLGQAVQIKKAFTAMGGFLIEVEKDTDAENQQKSYYEIQRSLSSGAVSSLRSCCFKLYRSHVTDPKQFKEAEAQYKVVIKALEKFSVYALKASRNEIKGDELKILPELLTKLSDEFAAYVSIVTPGDSKLTPINVKPS